MDIDDLSHGLDSAMVMWQVFRSQNRFDEEGMNRSPRQFLAESRPSEPTNAVAYFTWMQSPEGWRDDSLLKGLALPGVPMARSAAEIEPENVAWCVVYGPEEPWEMHSDYPVFISRNLAITTEDVLSKEADDYIYCSTNAPFGRTFSLCIRLGGKISVFPGSRVRVGELFPEFILTNRASHAIWRPD